MKNQDHNNCKFSSNRTNKQSGKSKANFIMILAFAMLIFAGAILFLNSKNLHGSAVDEAALAAAREMSEIVVNTPECGFVSLSDKPSDGKGTEGGDKFASPVRGINTIIGTARLDLIIADKLDQGLMAECAQKDLKDALAAKQQLIDVLEKSLKPGGLASDKDGKQISVYDSAVNAFKKSVSTTGSVDNKNVSLKLSLGSLETGLPTTVPLPEPQTSALVDLSLSDGKVYKSFVNIPYKKTDFVFGGIGQKVVLVDQKNWRAKIDSLPYQIPTIVKIAAIKQSGKQDSEKVVAVACAQPASRVVASVEPGALTISFPDGLVPEIKQPQDCYLNKRLNNREEDAMDLLTADGGDYPTDSGSVMKSMEWPLTKSAISKVSAADVWRQALHDWIRTAGPRANIDSVVNMQKVMLDAPRPGKIMWNAPVSVGAAVSAIAPIPAGIVHIFEFDRDGVVVYRSKILAPYPLDVISHHQMYGENFGALDNSEIGVQEINVIKHPAPKKIMLMAAWDVFIRDHVRTLGTINGGKHAGQPIAKPILASTDVAPDTAQILEDQLTIDFVSDVEEVDFKKGRRKPFGKARIGVMGVADSGFPPLITPQSDFSETMNPAPPFVRPMPFGSGIRPILKASAVDIRFRRQLDVTELTGVTATGYFGITNSNDY